MHRLFRSSAVALAFVLSATVALDSIEAQRPAAQKKWKLTWSDEFSGHGSKSPNPAKWQIITGGTGWYHNELEYYTARKENLRQKHGKLILEVRKEDYTGPDHVTKTVTSARLITQGKFTQRYGRFEARIKLPAGKGMWPAFWMLGDDHDTKGWPASGEIDVMENIGDHHRIYGTLHGPGFSGPQGLQSHYDLPEGQTVDGEFHLYAVEWEPEEIRFYVDNHIYATQTKAGLPVGATWVFDHPFYLLLNLGVGGSWPGYPDNTTKFPQQMLVDYIRVYER